MGAYSLLRHRRAALDAIPADLERLETPPGTPIDITHDPVFKKKLALEDIHYRYPATSKRCCVGPVW